jgi:hypothetical protein
MIVWFYYPKSTKPPALVLQVVDAFREAYPAIASNTHELPSNKVLAEVRSSLERAGFLVETGKKASEKILVPVLFG